jgi:AraC-like DNA-binding protein
MGASYEKVIPLPSATWSIRSNTLPEFRSAWHFHEEYELTLIDEGRGTRIVGDSVETYESGDLVLIGSDVPHNYVSDAGSAIQKAVVIQFRHDFLGAGFFDLPEFGSVAQMLDRSQHGLAFPDSSIAVEHLLHLAPAQRTVALIGLLVDLSAQPFRRLSDAGRPPALNRSAERRIAAMVALIHAEYPSPLTLSQIADVAHLTPSSASRLFARCTGTTISHYMNVVRVSAACRELAESDKSIAVIAAESGYANLSNFNRHFRDLREMTPREYRRLLGE